MSDSQQTSLLPFLEPEDLRRELKSCEDGTLPSDLWKTISAFANTEGGQILLGVGPDQKPIGLSSEKIDRLQRDLLSLCQGKFNYPIPLDVQVVGSVVVAYIQPAPVAVRPVYSTSRGIPRGAYVRVGSSSIQASDEILTQFSTAARGGAELIVYSDLNYEDCFDFSIVDDYIEMVNRSRGGIFRDVTRKEVLLKMRAIDKKGSPTLFGVLVFSRDTLLQEITAPTTSVSITQYATDSKVDPSSPETTFIDDKDFTGNVLSQFEEASAYIRSKLPVRGVVDKSGKRQEYLSIPEIAIREALANAITHRDYATYSSRVQVDIYSNRIEIINPGPSLVPIESIDTTPSVSRNPSLMSFLKDFHITEQRARGIRTIRESLQLAGLPEPLFENLPTSFRVTLYNSAFMSSDDHKWLSQFKKYSLNERQLTALSHLRNNSEGISNSEYRSLNHMNSIGDDRRANYELNRMVKFEIITHNGADRNRRYYLED